MDRKLIGRKVQMSYGHCGYFFIPGENGTIVDTKDGKYWVVMGWKNNFYTDLVNPLLKAIGRMECSKLDEDRDRLFILADWEFCLIAKSRKRKKVLSAASED